MTTSKPAGSWLAWALLLTLCALSVLSLASIERREARVPSDATMRAASDVIRTGFAEGDGVIVVPPWEERPWRALQGIGPGTEAFPFPALARGDRDDPARLLSFERLWVIGAFDKPPEPKLLLESDRVLLSQVEVGEGVQVALYKPSGLASLARLTSDFPKLHVARRDEGGQVRACTPGAERHICGLQPWYDLHFQTRDVFHQQVTWLYAHPGPGTRTLMIEWPDLPRGEAVLLRFGYTLASVRHEEGEAPEILVRIDGQEAARVSLPPWTYAMERVLLPVPRGDGPVRVEIELHSADPRRREVLLDADMLAEVKPSVAAWATRDLRGAR
jgi:hypothetical protein